MIMMEIVAMILAVGTLAVTAWIVCQIMDAVRRIVRGRTGKR